MHTYSVYINFHPMHIQCLSDSDVQINVPIQIYSHSIIMSQLFKISKYMNEKITH